jgi:cytochrome P450
MQTPVAMAIYNMHYDAHVFPAPFTFKPERWLGDIDPRMNKYFAPWGKGSRDCPGKK